VLRRTARSTQPASAPTIPVPTNNAGLDVQKASQLTGSPFFVAISYFLISCDSWIENLIHELHETNQKKNQSSN
jgi:hypothetical protein